MIKTTNRRLGAICIGWVTFIIGLSVSLTPLNAHPHVWIEVHNAISFDDEQRVVSIEVYWRFDEFYSAFAIQGLDSNNDGEYSATELAILLQDNLKEMGKTNYYTQTLVNGETQSYSEAAHPQVSYQEGLLSMRFSLVLTTPVKATGKTINIASFDPTYYIALDLAEQQPASLLGATTSGCNITIKRPEQSEPAFLDDSIATTDAKIARSYALQATTQIEIKC